MSIADIQSGFHIFTQTVDFMQKYVDRLTFVILEKT